MNRITEKDGVFYKLKPENEVYGWEDGIRLVQIVGRLEDLEEQIGCPFEVLFRALKDGIYHNEKFEHPILILDEDSFKENSFNLMVVGTIVYLKEYKKTWWLKEDKSE